MVRLVQVDQRGRTIQMLIGLLVLLTTLSLAACSSDEPTATPAAAPATEAAQATSAETPTPASAEAVTTTADVTNTTATTETTAAAPQVEVPRPEVVAEGAASALDPTARTVCIVCRQR